LQEERSDHVGADHPFKRDALRPERCRLSAAASHLYRLAVTAKTIHAISRHWNVDTTMDIYVKTVSADSTPAMQLLETALLCTNCAPTPTPATRPVVN
jgi:integrase